MKKWWKVPVILSAGFGFVPLMFAVVSGLYGFGHYVVGGLVMLLFVLAAIWLVTGIVLVVRRLRGRRIAAT